MSSGSFTCGVVWRANAVRVTVLEGIRCPLWGKRSLVGAAPRLSRLTERGERAE